MVVSYHMDGVRGYWRYSLGVGSKARSLGKNYVEII